MRKDIRNLLLVFCCLFDALLYGQIPVTEPQILADDLKSLTISSHLVYSSDTILDFNTIRDQEFRFETSRNPFVNRGVFQKYHWLKFQLKNNSNSKKFILEFNQTYVDSLQMFLLNHGALVKKYPKKGLHFEDKDYTNFLSNKYAYIFPFEMSNTDDFEVYLFAVVNDGPFKVMNKIWTEESYKKREKNIKIRTSYLLVFLGFAALILLLSFTMFVFSRKLMYLYYSGFVLVVFFSLLGLRYLVSPLFFEKYLLFGNNFVEMFGMLQSFFMLKYASEFFSLKKRNKRYYNAINFVALTVITIFLLGLFLRRFEWYYSLSYYFTKFLLLATTVVIYYVAIVLAIQKERMAYYFIIAYLPLAQFIGHYILTAMNLTDSYNPLEWEIVMFIEIVVLAIALAHKYFQLIHENTKYQQLLIEQKEKGMRAMLVAQESERARIAKDIHDGIVQEIGSVLLRARRFFEKKNLIQEKEPSQLLEHLENSNLELRNLSHQMMPKALSEFGLIPAIEDLLSQSFPYANIEYEFENFNLTERIPKNSELVLFRVLQELVQNIIKHSKANQATVQLFQSGKNILLLVEDNGIGIDLNELNKGIGLTNIQSRLETIAGEVNFDSSSKNGTLVTVKIPIL